MPSRDTHPPGRPDPNTPDVERRRSTAWRRVFDLVYRRPSTETAWGDDLRGWEDPGTGRPIPADAMREWLDEVTRRIVALRPNRIIDIGSGTGNLMMRLAPHVDHYVAVDPSAVALERLGARALEAGFDHVDVVQAYAGDLPDSSVDPADTVVCNSVCQYFPSLTYLERVVRWAMVHVGDGGRVFVGDIPNGALAMSPQAPDELAPPPSFFQSLAGSWTSVPLLKLGRAPHALNLFRYDVVLAKLDPAERPPHLRWRWDEVGSSGLPDLLRASSDQVVVLTGVPNARLSPDRPGACHPADAAEVARPTGYVALPVWLDDTADGAYALFCKRRPRGPHGPYGDDLDPTGAVQHALAQERRWKVATS